MACPPQQCQLRHNRTGRQRFASQLRFGSLQVVRCLDRPQRPPYVLQFRGAGDALVTQKLGPGARRGVGEVVHRPFTLAVPASRRLIGGFPKKREPLVAVAVQDHVAGEAARDRASSRTREGPEPPGFQGLFRSSAGARPPNWTRLR